MKSISTIKNHLITLWILLLSIPVMAQDANPDLTLKECLQIGLEKNHAMVTANLEQTRAQFRKREADSEFFPQIEGYGTYDDYLSKPVTNIPGEIFGQSGTLETSLESQHNMAVGLKATQLLYDRSASTSRRLAKKMEEVSAANLQKTAGDVIYGVTVRYFQVQLIANRRRIVRENMERLHRLLGITEVRHQAGIIRTVDVKRVKADRENMATKLGQIDTRYAREVALLKYDIGMKQQRRIRLVDPLKQPLPGVDLSAMVFNNKRPELQLLEKQKELSLLNLEMTRSEYFPTFSFYARHYYQAESDSLDFFDPDTDRWKDVSVVGLTFSIPLFNGFRTDARTNQASIDYVLASSDYADMQRYYGVEYENAVKQYHSSKDAETRQYRNAQLAETIYDQMLLHYQQGIASLSDLLEAENSLGNANLALFDAMLQLRLAELEILKTTGELESILTS